MPLEEEETLLPDGIIETSVVESKENCLGWCQRSLVA
jgi:hypothetical protein